MKYLKMFESYQTESEESEEIISPLSKWDEDQMDLFEDLSVIQDDGEAVDIDRLNFFLEEIGLEPLEKVEGYINI